ncbi:MAG TPA: hypothetical protein VEL74_08320 [Thermoanaerobaculia bacterium]|nr:hypothetical protein [Thermoanaerobaculia bacterium]
MEDRAQDTPAAGVEVTERGNIYFFYRPAVGAAGEDGPHGLVDVQRFHLVLSPKGRDTLRVITIGKKRLPEPRDSGQRFWGYVERVADDPDAIVEELEGGREEGRTWLPARPAGEGVYAIACHGNHTHLLYALELPEEPDEVQRELHIGKEGSYLLSVKNPQASSPPSVGLDEEKKAEFPGELQELFGGRRFIACEPPSFLDHEGAELLLMGSADDPGEDLGIDLDPEHETEATADLFQELQMERQRHPVEPLLAGKWA